MGLHVTNISRQRAHGPQRMQIPMWYFLPVPQAEKVKVAADLVLGEGSLPLAGRQTPVHCGLTWQEELCVSYQDTYPIGSEPPCDSVT